MQRALQRVPARHHDLPQDDPDRCLPQLAAELAGFAIEPEITARLVQKGERIFEVPVHYRARATDEGKKLTARDGFRVIGTLLRCRFGAIARLFEARLGPCAGAGAWAAVALSKIDCDQVENSGGIGLPFSSISPF